MDKILMVDVESIGLHGEPFAIAFVATQNGSTLQEGCFSCPLESAHGDEAGRRWVKENCPPLIITHDNPEHMLNSFWEVFSNYKKHGFNVYADCGFPVETNMFAMMTRLHPSRYFEGPYPLHEVATVLSLAGLNTDDYPRQEGEECHHPLGDARYSTRMLITALDLVKEGPLQ